MCSHIEGELAADQVNKEKYRLLIALDGKSLVILLAQYPIKQL